MKMGKNKITKLKAKLKIQTWIKQTMKKIRIIVMGNKSKIWKMIKIKYNWGKKK
jgi:hypothetical protein